ncbi:MAG: glycoside hydrolase family 127 protein [Lachnospiraceae bacterium]|nr:glycoside hydrolase family 127 protein [Lachnospiraceae bacterium]
MKNKLGPFSEYGLDRVLITDAWCVNAYEKDVAWLLSLDEERLLAGFYENAGLSNEHERYPGWESMLIGGHTLGHYLTAAAQGFKNAEVSAEQKEGLFAKIKRIIDGLLECQQHSKGKPGFVFGAMIRDPENVELQFDEVEQGRTNIITEAWVPWYTMHKILDGVVNAYRYTDYAPALTLAEGIGDWSYARSSQWSEETHRTVLGIEYGGMNDALYSLYRITHKEEHLAAAHAFDETALFEKIASGEKNVLNNRHANTTIPKFLGALNRYVSVGDETYLDYAKAFWDMVTQRHSYATGGNSEWEHFGEDYILDAERTNCNNETCNTFNMLKLTRGLFMITGERKYAAYYENTLFNAILSSQDPESGMTMYFQPMASGYYKVYGTPFDKFWCCTGTGMENFTKLNSSIYFKEENGVCVNLFLSSELTDDELGIKLIQEADVPANDTVRFTLKLTRGGMKNMKLRIRIPDWSLRTMLSAKGKQVTEEGGYYSVYGEWRDGDVIELRFVYAVQTSGLPDCNSVFAFRYGPLLLSADLGTENMIDSSTGVDVTIPSNKIVESEYLTVSEGSVADFIRDIDKHFEKDADELRFTLKDCDRELVFRPHYKKTRERYGIYWYFFDKLSDDGEAQKEKRLREEARRERIVDTVQPGYGQYENDELHAMEDHNSVGITDNGTSRHTLPNGSFCYHMKAEGGRDYQLELHLLREDNGKPLRVQIGEDEIFNGKAHYTGKDEEYVLELPIPADLVDKNLETRDVAGESVTTIPVRFSGTWSSESAKLFGFIYLLRAQD